MSDLVRPVHCADVRRRGKPMTLRVVALLLAAPGTAVGQATVGVRGQLLRAGDRTPVADAIVELVELNRLDTTSQAGRFRFADVPGGTYRLRVRRIGYHPFVDALSVAAPDTAERTILIPEIRATLPTVVVRGRAVNVPPRFDEPYRRAAAGNGFFFTREHIEEANPRDLETLMNRVPGVRMNDRGITFERCQAGVPSPLGGPREPAKVQVWIDGYRMTNRIGRSAADQPHEIIRSVIPSSIQIIEVYTGVANIPAEFLDDACAVVVIWRRPH